MEDLHEPLQQLAKSIGPDLYGEAKRNLSKYTEGARLFRTENVTAFGT